MIFLACGIPRPSSSALQLGWVLRSILISQLLAFVSLWLCFVVLFRNTWLGNSQHSMDMLGHRRSIAVLRVVNSKLGGRRATRHPIPFHPVSTTGCVLWPYTYYTYLATFKYLLRLWMRQFNRNKSPFVTVLRLQIIIIIRETRKLKVEYSGRQLVKKCSILIQLRNGNNKFIGGFNYCI